MRICIVALFLALVPRGGRADEPPLPRTVAEAQALLDGLAANLETYRNDRDAQAAAPDAIEQAGPAIDDARARLVQLGVAGAAPELRRAQLLLDLIAQLIAARTAEQAADAIAEQVVDALERLAVARDAYERVTEQLELFAIPMPGEAGR